MRLDRLPAETRVFTAWAGDEINKNGPRRLAAMKHWNRVRRYLGDQWPKADPQMRYMHSMTEVEAWIEDATGSDYIVVDTEYTYPGPKNVYMLGLYSPTAGTLQWEAQGIYLPKSWVGGIYKRIIAMAPIVLQNFKADIPSMQQTFGVEYGDYTAGVEDTILMHHVLWTEMPHDLGFLEGLYSDHEKAKHLQGVDERRYNAYDCITAGTVYEKVRKELEQDPGCFKVYREELLRLVPIVLRMERRGIPTNKSFVHSSFQDTNERVERASELADAYAGWPINLDSSDQLRSVLFHHEDVYREAKSRGATGIRVKKTPKGVFSVADEVVAALRQAYEPINQDRDINDWEHIQDRLASGAHPLLEARAFHIAARQNRSSYLIPLLRTPDGKELTELDRKRVAKTGDTSGLVLCDRIHAEFGIDKQATGRWSTKNPPLAQLPGHLRDILGNDEEWPEYHFDWDQIELRIVAAQVHL